MLEKKFPEQLKTLYPFGPKKMRLKDGHKISYLDEGKGHPIFLVHGNPTWSFYYRNLVQGLKSDYRTIAIDHLGCGLSDKPQDYEYTLENHIDNLEQLRSELGIKSYSMIVHDWGGAIGCGMAIRRPEELKSLVILNTAAFTSKQIPFRINICRTPFLGERLIRHFNAFAWPATFMAVKKKMDSVTKKGYLYPYSNYQTRIATAKFVQDIPMDEEHPSYQTLKSIEESLKSLNPRVLILWGEKDFCFDMNFYQRWKEIFPKAHTITYKDAGHYIIEDKKEESLEEIKKFFKEVL